MSELRLLTAWLRGMSEASADDQARAFSKLSAADLRAFAWLWRLQAQQGQQQPSGNWTVWLMMAGRGFGKTRTGAEWVLEQARQLPDGRIALVGGSIEEVARVMVEGESGLLACAPPDEKLDWCLSRSELRFPSGAIAHAFSGAHGDRLRGPQHHLAWADELAKWTDGDATWDNLMMGMRLGERPRVLVTTTPRKSELLERIRGLPGTVVTGGRTRDNRHLPAAFIAAMEAAYRDSRLGRQELDGELIGEAEGALWTRALLEERRVAAPPKLVRVVIGVDPPASANGDACGIVVCGCAEDGRGFVLADASVRGLSPNGWARKVAEAAAAWNVDRVVAEANNGGLMVTEVLRGAEGALPVKQVHASRGKVARAEPIAALFESGKCWLAGRFPALEDELSGFTAGGYAGAGSPDRADAMVWALSELMLGKKGLPSVRGFG